MNEVLLVLWLAVISLERVDFLGGRGPFLLTPYLLLTSLIVILEVVRIAGRGGGFRVPRNAADFGLLSSAFLAVVLVSVFASFDIAVSAKRYVLLAFQVYTSLLMVVFLAQRPNPARILVRGAYAGLVLGTALNVSQLVTWFKRGGETVTVFGDMLSLTANTYGPWAPRLSGPSLDMNRGGLVFVVYMFLLLTLAPRSRVRTVILVLGGLSVLMTLSRSLLGGVLVMGAVAFLTRRRISFSRRQAFTTVTTLAVLLVVALTSTRVQEALEAMWGPLVYRFSAHEESANIHVQLMVRAVDVALESPKNALVGIGYGNSFLAVQDFFPGNKYGNFHSIYLALLAECGGIALILGGFLFLYPAARGGMYRPLIIGIAVFNIAYQLVTEPMFWLTLVLAWTRFCDPTTEGVAAPQTGRQPRLREVSLAPSG